MTDLSLAHRTGLPPALRVLAEELPRLTWPDHPDFGGLAAFWLDRHMDFRRLAASLREATEARLDDRIAARDHAQRVGRLGQALVGTLHGHHQIEDAHYFPAMVGMDPRVARAFDILDADHHDLDGVLARFVEAANGVLRDTPDAAGRFHAELLSFERLLDRHLEDEEDIVVPLILRHGLR